MSTSQQFDDLEAARRNRERIAEMRRKEAADKKNGTPTKRESEPILPIAEKSNFSLPLDNALNSLQEDEEKAFCRAYGEKMAQYHIVGDEDYDSYIETLCERNNLESLSEILKHWIKYLTALPDSQNVRGAIRTLETLDHLCVAIDKLLPKE